MGISERPYRQLVISVLGHSGSMYASKVFQAIGLDIQHEAIGRDGGVGCNMSGLQKENYPIGLSENALILHQVREPLAAIGSLRTVPDSSWDAFQEMAIRTGMSWRPLKEPLVKNAMTVWLNYNEGVEDTAEFTYRVEDMDAALPVILELMGLPNMPMPGISKKTNSHSDLPILSWDELYSVDAELTARIISKAKQYGYTDLPTHLVPQDELSHREVILIMELGIGDLVFAETGIRLLLNSGIKTVHLFARRDGMELYHNYDGVSVYPFEAKSSMMELMKKGIPVIEINSDVNIKFPVRHRVDFFAYYMLSSIKASFPDTYPQPELSVAPEHIDWAEMYVNKAEGQPTIVWQMESPRNWKSLPREQSIRIIDRLLEQGYKVFVQSDNFNDLPRNKNLKLLRGISIERFMGICKVVDKVLAMDSAPAWIAAAVGTEAISIFGPTSPMRYALQKPNVSVLQWNPNCGNQPCETGCSHNACMNQIPDALIMDAIDAPENIPKWREQIEQMGRLYPYIPSKTPMAVKDRYKLMVLIPHIYLGGGETQMEYLLDHLTSSFDITIVVVNAVDESLYPRWKKKYDIVHLSGTDKVWALRNLIVSMAPDVVLYHGDTGVMSGTSCILPETLQGIKHKPVMIQIAHTGHGPWTENVMREMVDYNDHIITVAAWLKEKFSAIYPHRFTSVLNGVPITENRIPKKRREINLGIMSRLVGGKGLDTLIDAMKILPDRVRLFIAGWGQEETRLRRKAKPLGDRIVFLGQVMERKSFFDNIDCAILPSDAEGNSMFLLEAAMESKPIIATNVGAVPELFEHNSSALIIDGTAEGIKQAVMRINNEVGIKRRLGQAAHNIVSGKANSSIMAKGYIDVIMGEIGRRQDPKTILCFREFGRGDVLMTGPALKTLRKRFPGAKITYLLPPSLAAVIDGLDLVDEIIVRDGADDSLFRQMSAQYDVALSFKHDEVWETWEHIIDHYLEMVGYESGDYDTSVSVDHIEIPKYEKPYVCLHVQSPFRCKNWGQKTQWDKIVDYLKERYNVIQIGGDDQYDLGVTAAYKDALPPAQTMRLLRDAEFFIGIDSFPVHAAKAVGCKSIVIYGGASNPAFCGYDDNRNLISSLDCACEGSKAHAFTCTKDYACMRDITSSDVINAIKMLDS